MSCCAQASQLFRDNAALVERLAAQGAADPGGRLSLKGTYSTHRRTQFVALARKYRLSYWRSPSYNLTRMLMTLLICLFYGTMFWRRGRLPKDGVPFLPVPAPSHCCFDLINEQFPPFRHFTVALSMLALVRSTRS